MSKLRNTVIENNYCIGCGVCAVVSDDYKIKMDDYGRYQANFIGNIESVENEQLVNNICPFSNNSKNESEISEKIFESEENDLLGRYDDLFIGYSEKLREIGASGGGTTWFLLKAVDSGIVDGVIHLKEAIKSNGDKIFEYNISDTKGEILEAAKTKYYPGELSGVLKEILMSQGKKYAIVGVPCFIKSVRLLAEQNIEIKKRITLFVGLVCGHYKSGNYALMLALQKGIKSDSIKKFDFRHKTGRGNAGNYNTHITYSSNNNKINISNESVKNFYGTDWGLGMFKYNACDYCDDVVAETADVSFGDAWISPYTKDPMGTNIIISRTKEVSDIFYKGSNNDDFVLEKTSKEQIIKTQLAGFRHRREGLKLRLKWKRNRGEWVPNKRIDNKNIKLPSLRYRMIYFTRMIISKKSHIYFKKSLDKNSFEVFVRKMFPIVFFYKYVLYLPNRVKNFIANMNK